MKKGTILTVGFLLFIGYISFSLIWTGNKYECEVCVKFKDAESCQTVRGAEKNDTLMQGVSTACGAVARGMTDSIECQRTPPIKQECKNL